MNRFKKILFVPPQRLTEPDPSFRRAVQLAKDNHAQLTVFGVINDHDLSDASLAELVYHERLPDLSSLATHARQHGVSTRFKLVQGIPFLRIVREVLKHGHDLVISHMIRGRTLKDWLFGGTNLHLLRKCPTPVWIMKPEMKEQCRHVLAAVNPASPPPAGGPLNQAIIEMAASLAQREKASLHLLHAWSHTAEDLLKARGNVDPARINQFLQKGRAQHLSGFKALVEKASPLCPSLQAHFVEGPPSHVIPEQVDRLQIDLLVLGTIGRTGISGFLIGNTAEQIFEQVQCPVLAVKPEGFSTPVSLQDT